MDRSIHLFTYSPINFTFAFQLNFPSQFQPSSLPPSLPSFLPSSRNLHLPSINPLRAIALFHRIGSFMILWFLCYVSSVLQSTVRSCTFILPIVATRSFSWDSEQRRALCLNTSLALNSHYHQDDFSESQSRHSDEYAPQLVRCPRECCCNILHTQSNSPKAKTR